MRGRGILQSILRLHRRRNKRIHVSWIETITFPIEMKITKSKFQTDLLWIDSVTFKPDSSSYLAFLVLF